eukprot:4879699-Amphidinium_carterae.1
MLSAPEHVLKWVRPSGDALRDVPFWRSLVLCFGFRITSRGGQRPPNFGGYMKLMQYGCAALLLMSL